MVTMDTKLQRRFDAVKRYHFFLQRRRHMLEESLAEESFKTEARDDVGVNSTYGPVTIGAAYKELDRMGAYAQGE
jgi:hypothetical protein